jgi:hypothetical protein
MRSYSIPFSLQRYKNLDWINGENDLHYIAEDIDTIKHIDLVTKTMTKNLRNASLFERRVIDGNTEWSKPNVKSN